MRHDDQMPLDPSKINDSAEHDAVSATPAGTADSSLVTTIGPDTDVPVAAFVVGQLLNGLAFSLIHTWLEPRGRHPNSGLEHICARDRSWELIQTLARSARFLRQRPSERDEIQAQIRRIFEPIVQ
jgi:hypothetical protein